VLAGALTVAVGGAIFAGVKSSSSGRAAESFTAGLSAAIWFLAGLMALGTVLTWIYVRSAPRPEAPAAAAAPAGDHPQHLHHRRFHL
jgi:hypothetical protein